jgi:hypothetical protein
MGENGRTSGMLMGVMVASVVGAAVGAVDPSDDTVKNGVIPF